MTYSYDYVRQRMAEQQDSAQRRRLVTQTRRRPATGRLVPFVRRRHRDEIGGCRA